MEINREKFRVAALLIALANGGCVARQSQINFREEQTSWTGSAPQPTYTPGPTNEAYPTPYPPPAEYGGPAYEYVPPPSEEWYPPPQEYYPPPMEGAPFVE
jgi:hypothetical protein